MNKISFPPSTRRQRRCRCEGRDKIRNWMIGVAENERVLGKRRSINYLFWFMILGLSFSFAPLIESAGELKRLKSDSSTSDFWLDEWFRSFIDGNKIQSSFNRFHSSRKAITWHLLAFDLVIVRQSQKRTEIETNNKIDTAPKMMDKIVPDLKEAIQPSSCSPSVFGAITHS